MLKQFSIFSSSLIALCIATAAEANNYSYELGSNSEEFEQIEDTLDKGDEIIDKGEEIVNIVKKWTGPKPEPRRTIEFSNTQLFDMTVNRSLRKKYADVKITETNFRTDAIPQRLDLWFKRVEKKRGMVAICPVTKGEEIFGLSAVFDIVIIVIGGIGDLIKKADRWATYRPAKRYHAAILVELGEGQTAKDFDPKAHRDVVGVTFYYKKKFGNLSKSCTNRKDLKLEKISTGV